MNADLKDTLLLAADYSHEKTKHGLHRISAMFLIEFCAMVTYLVLLFLLKDTDDVLWSFTRGVIYGSSTMMMLIGFIFTGPFADKVCGYKKRLLRRS